MSASLILQQYDNVVIGADTAVSTAINGDLYRISNNGKKIFIIDNQLIFCAGDLKASYEIMNVYKQTKIKNKNILQKVCRKILPHNDKIVEIVLAKYNHMEDRVELHQISSYNNFDIVERKIAQQELAILSAGIKTKECFQKAFECYNKNPSVEYIYRETYNHIGFEGIGGNLKVYEINKAGINLILNTKIIEKNIRYLCDFLSIANSSLVVAESVYGKVVASNKLVITNRNKEGKSSFIVDENHMKAVNMDLSLETASRTNRIFLNPSIGIRLQKRPSVGHQWEDMIKLNIEDGSGWAMSWNILNTNTRLDDKGLRIDNGKIWINNEAGDDVFTVNTQGEVDAMGRFRIFRKAGTNTITLGDYYKDEGRGGKIQLNDWNGVINAFLGSAPSSDYIGGFLKLYNDEDKERIEIGTKTEGDTGIIKIKNYEQKELISLTGNNLGATIKLNNKEEKTKLFMSSQDEELNQGIVKLYGEDDHVKLMLKAKSSTDNMSDTVVGDRKTGGLIQLSSYDNSHQFFITANNENNFGMYDVNGSAFEINTSTDAVICNHRRLSSFSLAKGGISINVTDLNNLRVAVFKDRIEGLPYRTLRLPAMMVVNSNFRGSGSPTVITHNFGDVNYGVSLSPVGQPDSRIGQYSFILKENTVEVYNTGKGTSSFQCILFR